MGIFGAVPHDTPMMTSFLRRDAQDKLMFGWVRATKKLLPAVSLERSLAMFAHEFGIREFNAASQRIRYQRMEKEFFEEQRQKGHEQGD